GYKKKGKHDLTVPRSAFQSEYIKLKEKYKHWVKDWPESTDPLKMIYEDIAIASFLICYWRESKKEIRFVDMGCGNGFLTYVLTQEGYSGYGIDQSKRKVWDMYPQNVTLIEKTLYPKDMNVNANFIIGNHADELIPWIPILAHRANASFMALPCCFHLLNGRKMTHTDHSKTQYQQYLQYVESIIVNCGYVSTQESLRIPSTKNICFLADKRSKG
ncbi:DUF1613-domain-containing protein, partial [Rozella allomycis CSF55]